MHVHSLYFLWMFPFRGSGHGTDRLRPRLSFPGGPTPSAQLTRGDSCLSEWGGSSGRRTLPPGPTPVPPRASPRPERGSGPCFPFPLPGRFTFSRRPCDLTNFIASAVGAGLNFFPTSFYSFQLIELSTLKAKLHTRHPARSAVPTPV